MKGLGKCESMMRFLLKSKVRALKATMWEGTLD